MRRKTHRVLAAAIGVVAGGAGWAEAQVSYGGGTYLQDFDTLTNTTAGTYGAGIIDLTAGPASATGLVGWQAANVSPSNPQTAMKYDFVNDGTGTGTALGTLGSFGASTTPTDRALGSVSTTPTQPRFGVRLVNNTASTFTTVSISFDLEQWRRNSQTNYASNTAGFVIGDSTVNINSPGFINRAEFDFRPFVTTPDNTPLDGNANHVTKSVVDLPIGSWAPGQVFVFRWNDGNEGGSDDLVAIDNFSFTAGGSATNLVWNKPAGGAWNNDAANLAWLNGVTPSAFANGNVVTFGNAAANVPVAVEPGGVAPAVTNVTNNTATGTYTFDGGPILGGALIKTGAGNIVLKVANGFTSASLAGGTVETQVDGALGSGDLTLINTTLKVTTAGQTIANAIAFSGTATISNTVPLTLSGNVTSPAGAQLILENNTPDPLLVPNMPNSAGNLRVTKGLVKYSGFTDDDLLNGATVLTVDAGATFDFGINGETFGALEGAGNVILTDTPGSFLNLTGGGNHTFGGVISGTTVNGATLGLNQNNGGATSTFTGKSTFLAPTTITAGTIVVGGDVKPDEDGPLGHSSTAIQIGVGGASAPGTLGLLIAGPYEISRPIVTAANTNGITITIGGTTNENSVFSGDFQLDKSSRLTSVATGTNAVTFSGIIHETTGTHGITKVGAGIVVLSNPNNTYTAGTIVNAGTLRVTGSISTSNLVTVNNTGTFDAAAIQTVRALTVNSGGVTKVTAGVLKVGDDTTAAPLTISSAGTNTGKVDLTKRGLIVDHAPGAEAAALAEVRTQVLLGYNGGLWTGNGITSSDAAAAPSNKAVGYALATEAALEPGGLFLGQLVDPSSVVARYTLAGDANLDGKVGFPDLVTVAQNYDAVLNDQANFPAAFTDSWWAHGDFNYDGKVGFPDLVAVAQNYDAALPGAVPGGSPEFNAALAAAFAASVPEPSAVMAAVAAGAAMLTRRRRR